MKWSKDEIISDLGKLFNGKIEEEEFPQGEHYCRDIFLCIEGESDAVRIIGFIDSGDLSDVDNPVEDVEYVEIRNLRSDSDGGLSKRCSKSIRDAYHIAVDYFNTKNVSVVDNIEDYF